MRDIIKCSNDIFKEKTRSLFVLAIVTKKYVLYRCQCKKKSSLQMVVGHN